MLGPSDDSIKSRGKGTLVDIQSHADERRIPIDRVGVSNLSYPIVVLDRANQRQTTVASLAMSVNLPHHFKGTHMSRFVEVLNAHRGEMTIFTLPLVLRELRERLQAESARVEVRFPYFLERVAPFSGARALMGYECSFLGEANETEEDFVLGVRVPVTSLCLCSKAISDYGAHNQRGYVSIEVRGANGEANGSQLI
jgi:GTP cyclohydrolase I